MVDENRFDVFGPPLVVGFEDEAVKIMERLDGKPKHLDAISIVGMPGIGKTTLALKVYNDPYVAHQFYIRAWVSVSQAYNKRDLLLGILKSPNINPTQPDLSDEKLTEALYKRLKGNKYLILLDDIWDIEAWEDLKRSFPNDNNGSRIMFTTRIRDVALSANNNSLPHDMRFLSGDESWDLLKEKVFQKEMCPPELLEVGKEIAKNCGGLPLALVTIGGLLAKTEKTYQWWAQVGESIASYIVCDSSQSTKTLLELSYNHLPEHLKPLFLYFGAFPEDYEIYVSKMILLWIAEGFIKKESGGAAETTLTIEDVAERYLMDLIERSLILIANTRYDGKVKSCRIHDLLRDLCIVKAEEENFMHIIHRFEHPFLTSSTIHSSSTSTSFSSSSSPIGNKFNRLSITNGTFKESPFHHHYQNICSLLVFPAANFFPDLDLQHLKLLRVLDLSYYDGNLPSNILGQLVHLRYLVSCPHWFPKSVFKLKNLEVLIVGHKKSFKVDNDIFQMTKLRHLHIGNFDTPRSHCTEILADLQSISTPIFLNSNYTLLLATPNLRKLECMCDHRFIGPIRELGLLEKLEKLDMLSIFPNLKNRIITVMPFDLPASLKRITLEQFQFDWKEISKLARLPNLEVLKLLEDAFCGNLWDTSLLESNFQPFPKLKFLKFDSLNIVQWNIASVDHFPTLERLVVNDCRNLEVIPSDLGDIPTLKTIDVDEYCRHSVKCSARKILEEQRDKGNDQLEIFVAARRLMVSHSSCSTGSSTSSTEDEDEDEDEEGRGMVKVMMMRMFLNRV